MDTPGADLATVESWHRAGRLVEALAGYERLAHRDTADPEPAFRVSLVKAELGDLAAARRWVEIALGRGERAHHRCWQGDLLERLGEGGASIEAWERACRIDPLLAPAHRRLGAARLRRGEHEPALASFTQAVRLAPADEQSRAGLCRCLLALGRHGPAREEACRLVALDADRGASWDLAGIAAMGEGAPLDALECLEEAVQSGTTPPATWVRLAEARILMGLAEEGVEALAKAESLAPGDRAIGSARLFALHYRDGRPEGETLEAHRRWAGRHAKPAAPPRVASADGARALRIGYLSPRFRTASAAFVIAPLIERHDVERFRIHCYAEQEEGEDDEVTARIRRAGVAWTRTAGLSDEALAARIRDDRIDILVDLAGHTPGTRIAVARFRPAPLMGSWLDYFDTTGVEGVDFLVTDARSSPPGEERNFTERLLRLPAFRLCWEPPAYAPPVTAPPVERGEAGVTFGAFTRLAKISPPTLAAWSALLDGVPGARLLVKSGAIAGARERAFVERRFAEAGIDPDRLVLRGGSGHREMLREYGDIDIALDTFPYNGGITTLEALWMGRPVVSLEGRPMISRQSAGILGELGLDGLCARDAEGYVAIAAALARDAGRLAGLSNGLRDRLAASTVTDVAGFARAFEDGLVREWRRRHGLS